MQQFTSKEKFRLCNTLACVPLLLQGHAVLIDLLNETSVAGVLDCTDGFMNLHLSNAVLIDRNGGQHPFDEFMVRNRIIRQIHIPEYFDIEQEMRSAMQTGIFRRKRRERTAAAGSGKRTFKQKRAEVRHKETLEHIRQQKEKKATTVVSGAECSGSGGESVARQSSAAE